MDIEKIKQLRSQLALPIGYAWQLLQQNQGNVQQSIQAYHQQNIARICQQTECEESLAKMTYWRFFNTKQTDHEHCIAKAIKNINATITVISSHDPHSKIGFIMWGETQSGDYYQPFIARKHVIFVPSDDFDIILPYFKQVFPLQIPYGMEDSFDYCGLNWFDNGTFQQIINNIKANQNHICADNLDYQQFLQHLLAWWDELLSYAQMIVVEGTL